MSRKQLARSGGDLRALGTDDTGCVILHLDMDSFFVSVELLARPELVGLPVIVGGRSGRGVVTSASYEAREYGVHAAMPMARAIRLCPMAHVIEPSHGKYREYSRAVFDVVSEVTPDVAQVSVDEAYIDVSGAIRRLGSPARIAWELRRRIRAVTGLNASVGIATTMVVAKMASARAKPNGQLVVPLDQVSAFTAPMPVEALPGVGGRTQQILAGYGITTIGRLAECDPGWAQRVLGSAGRTLVGYARGHDERTVHMRAKDHSISAEHTFEQDVYDPTVLVRELLRLADTVASRLRAEGKVASGVGLKYRTGEFKTSSRQVTLPAPSDVAAELHRALLPGLRALHTANRDGVRLLGLRAGGLLDAQIAGRQETLFDPEVEPASGQAASMRPGRAAPGANRQAEVAADLVRKRFGRAAIAPASLLGRDPEMSESTGESRSGEGSE
jgi:DNA polymerase-4